MFLKESFAGRLGIPITLFKLGTELKDNPTFCCIRTQRTVLHHGRLPPHRATSEIFCMEIMQQAFGQAKPHLKDKFRIIIIIIIIIKSGPR